MRKNPQTEEKVCLNCNQTFAAPKAEIARGNAKFCCRKCFGAYRTKNIKPASPNCRCALCGKGFYRASAHQKSRSGLYFCCRAHKDIAQRIGGIREIMPSHYGTASNAAASTYRRIAFREHENCCAKCGYDTFPILQVHHIDGNHENSDLENLMIVCPTCHEEEHYLSATGRWSKSAGWESNPQSLGYQPSALPLGDQRS